MVLIYFFACVVFSLPLFAVLDSKTEGGTSLSFSLVIFDPYFMNVL